MTALLAVELRRIVARRLVRVFAALAVIGFAIAGVAVFFDSTEPDPFQLVSLGDALEGTTGLLIAIAWVVGGSFIGAEWHQKTIGTTLTWEPRRLRLLAAKVVAAVAASAAGTVLLLALLGAALLPAALGRGTTEGADADWLGGVVMDVLRGGLAAGLGAAVGFSIAAIARNTAAALGVGFIYVYIVEIALRELRPGWEPWLFVYNMGVLVFGEPPDALLFGRSVLGAALIVTAYAGGLLALALFLFQRRDVT